MYPNCPIEVDSLTAQADCTCVRPTSLAQTQQHLLQQECMEESFGMTPVAGTVGEVVVVGIIILAAVVAYMCVHRHKKKKPR